MSIQPNWQRGKRYYWIHASTLACALIGGENICGPQIPIYIKRPTTNPDRYHRCEIVVVRTKAEVAAVKRKFAAMRKQRELRNKEDAR